VRSTAAAEPEDAITPAPVPDGTYVAQTTGAEALALGLTDPQIEEIYGPDGLLEITLRLLGGNFTQYADYTTPGVPEPGDSGTYRFEGGQFIFTSTSPGCPGCVGVMDSTFDGSQLTLRFSDSETADPIARLIMEHDFTKTD